MLWQASEDRWAIWQENRITLYRWGSTTPEWETRCSGEPVGLSLADAGVYALTHRQLLWLPRNRFEPTLTLNPPKRATGLILWEHKPRRLLLWDNEGQLFTCDAVGTFSRPTRIASSAIALAVVRDSKSLVLADTGGALLYVDEKMQVKHRWQAHTGGITSMQLHPQKSDILLTTGYDGLIVLWSLRTGKYTLATVGHKGTPLSAVFLSNPSFVLTIGDDGLCLLWDLERPNVPTAHVELPRDGDPRLLQRDRQGRVWLVTDKAIHRWDEERRRWITSVLKYEKGNN